MTIIETIIFIIVFIISLSFHEFAHAWVAYRKGDSTPYFEGRVTLNPLRHIDLFGTVIFPIVLLVSGSRFLFGWAKPVRINPINLENPIKDFIWVAMAGPLANIILYLIGIIMILVAKKIYPNINHYGIYYMIFMVFYIFAFYLSVLNIILFFFNMIPVPPLDGSRLLLLFPISNKAYKSLQYIGIIALFALMFTGKFGYFIQKIVDCFIP